jgi:hypothetical protein
MQYSSALVLTSALFIQALPSLLTTPIRHALTFFFYF